MLGTQPSTRRPRFGSGPFRVGWRYPRCRSTSLATGARSTCCAGMRSGGRSSCGAQVGDRRRTGDAGRRRSLSAARPEDRPRAGLGCGRRIHLGGDRGRACERAGGGAASDGVAIRVSERWTKADGMAVGAGGAPRCPDLPALCTSGEHWARPVDAAKGPQALTGTLSAPRVRGTCCAGGGWAPTRAPKWPDARLPSLW